MAGANVKSLDLAKPVAKADANRPAWRLWLDQHIDTWMTSPGFYRWVIGIPVTRWVARRRATQLFDIMAGFVHSQVLLACLRLQLFELLREQPMGLEELAKACQISAPALQRLLHAAVSLRLLESRGSRLYGLGSLGAPVAADKGLQLMIEHNAVLFEDMRDPLALLRDQVRPSMQAYWPYMDGDNTQGWSLAQVARYSELMATSQRFVVEDMLATYDFQGHHVLLDVGGGEGAWVEALAQRAPHLQLMLFDLPPVAELAQARMQQLGLANRVTTHGGSFISDPLPPGADLVTLVRVAHDHPDGVVKALLAKIHQSLPRGGRLLLAEPMAQSPGEPPMVSEPYFHFYLLAMGSGKLRTPDELRGFMLEAGFQSVELLANPMPIHTRMLLARKS
ncbi:MAG: methyltransferase domain-containing protein [Betaproteobacteria bacterium]|nr:methyltransferase domain-containing protein [Betaproteobacteria bacterium]